MPAPTLQPTPLAFSTAHLSSTDLGRWNTTTRLIASLLSDGLLSGTTYPSPYEQGESSTCLLIHANNAEPSSPAVWIGLSRAGEQRLNNRPDGMTKLPAMFPGDFAPPVATATYPHKENKVHPLLMVNEANVTYAPDVLLAHLRSVIDLASSAEDDYFSTVCSELANSAANGAHWIEWYQAQKPLGFNSSMLEWEQALYTGHPLHPMHRSFSAKNPVPDIPPSQISSLMKHSISLISVPGSEVRVTGPVQQALKPLLSQYGLDHKHPGEVIFPCITMQIPVIKHYHPEMKVLVREALVADTQSSLRTITIPFSDYDFKFALDVTIGSALRTISSRTVTILLELSNLLREIMPDNMWLLSDVGGVTGVSDEFDSSKHISCVIRENMTRKALENNETMVVTGALQEIPANSTECNAALVFGLDTEAKKMKWFTEYTEGIIEGFLGLVSDYGVAFEAHAQNVLLRMDRATGKINGWASRDLGSIKVHTPTLSKSGYNLMSIPVGSLIPTKDEEETWRIIQFCLFHNHLNVFIYRLGVDRFVGWEMIRNTLEAFFKRRSHLENTPRLKAFLFKEDIPLKAFMRMKFAKKAAVYEYATVPNVLLERANPASLDSLVAPESKGLASTPSHQQTQEDERPVNWEHDVSLSRQRPTIIV